jgi:pSer/pThr/pTyr-binding forkhead associated (FHA) protein
MPPMKRVRVTLRGKTLQEVDVDRELTIGRKPPADLVVADGEVSSKHARLRPEGDTVLVCDLGSTNGTSIDGGARLSPQQEVPLAPGQKLVIGPAIVEIVEPPQDSSAGFASTEHTVAIGGGQMQSLLVNVARFKAAQGRLVVSAEHDRRVVPIEEMDVVVGRDAKQAQIAIQHQSVSARHARIKFENGRFTVEDLKSSNGTFVDGNPVVVATPLAGEQALTFGTVDCLFVQKSPDRGATSNEDRHAQALCDHAVRLGKATAQQAKEVLAEHRKSGAPIGQLFVERGALSPRDWAEIWRQRDIIEHLQPMSAKRGMSKGMIVGIVVVVLGLAALGTFLLMGK